MSYDPQDHIVEWRDVGAACALCALAFACLLVFGGARPIIGDDTAWRAARMPGPHVVHCHDPACAPGSPAASRPPALSRHDARADDEASC